MTTGEYSIEEYEHKESNYGKDDDIEEGRVDRVVHHLRLQGIVDILTSYLKRDK